METLLEWTRSQEQSIAPDEAERLEALRRLNLIGSEPEAILDCMVRMVSDVLQTPIALVSLVDDHQQWFKARVGLAATGTPREQAFCAHAIRRPQEVLMVPDALEDARFRDNPLVVGEPGIRFYAGAPLVTSDGHALGTLCVIDRQPRTLDATGQRLLQQLAREAAQILERPRRAGAGPSPEAFIDRALPDGGREMLEAMLHAGHGPKAFIDEHYVYRLVSRAWLDYSGLEPEQVIGRTVPGSDRSERFESLSRWHLDEALAGRACELERAEDLPRLGRRRLRHQFKPALDGQGRVFGVVLNTIDVEDLRVEQDRTRALIENLNRRNADHVRFVRVLSHDMKEPLNTIGNFADVLAQPGLDEAMRGQALAFVQRGARRLATLVDDLREYLRPDAPQLPFQQVDLAQTVDRVLDALAAQIQRSGAVIERAPLGGLVGSPVMLELMVQNLVSNALKFVAPGVSPRVRIGGHDEGDTLRLEVEDNGIGIPPEHADEVFEPFKRLHSRRAYEGSGLGLSFVRRVVELHEGRIRVQQCPGGGTRFVVHLPKASAAAASNSP